MAKHLIWFNPQIEIAKSILKEWTPLALPNEDIFWTEASKRFSGATVVFLQAEEEERGRIIPAARAVLEVSPDVRILRATLGTIITAEMLENAGRVPEALLDINEEDFATLSDVENVTQLHPAQDYHDSTFYYGTKIQGKDYLITSKPEMIKLIECPSRGITLIEPQLSMAGFSHSRVLDFFSGVENETPTALHTDIVSYIKRHFDFPSPETFDMLGVWIMGTYIFRAFRYFPYLHFNAEKGSGKTLLMELMSPISFNGVLMSQPSAATVLKLIEQDSATLFIDEAEGLGENRSASIQLKNILKTGFARSGIYYSGDEMYRTYSPKCFAGINNLDDVIADRTITVRLIRKIGYPTIDLYRETPQMRKLQSDLRDRLYLFGLQYGVGIAEDYSNTTKPYDKLTHLSNRAFDVWVPLYKVVAAFPEGYNRTSIFRSLEVLSNADVRRRALRDAEENETGVAIRMMDEVLTHVLPLESKDDMKYYDPDVIYDSLHRLELLPKSLQKKGLSRMLKRTLDIDSIPRAFGEGTKRMYAISTKELDSYRKRYADVVVE